MTRNKKFNQGIFRPSHPEKYKGTFPISYRSRWELVCMRRLDDNPNVLSWGSESVVIPYQNPLTGRVSRYFIDFNVVIRNKIGEIRKFLIEIKPHSQTLPPSQKKRNTKTLARQQAEYVKNMAKWKAAQAYAIAKNSSFFVLTEKHLNF